MWVAKLVPLGGILRGHILFTIAIDGLKYL